MRAPTRDTPTALGSGRRRGRSGRGRGRSVSAWWRPVNVAGGGDRYAVDAAGTLPRDLLVADIGQDQRRVALQRVAPATGAGLAWRNTSSRADGERGLARQDLGGTVGIEDVLRGGTGLSTGQAVGQGACGGRCGAGAWPSLLNNRYSRTRANPPRYRPAPSLSGT